MPGMNCGSSAKLNRKKSWFLSLKLTSMRVSKAFLCSNNFGDVVKFPKSDELVGFGKRPNSLRALRSKRPAALERSFRAHAPAVKAAVFGGQVPNGSRKNSFVPAATGLPSQFTSGTVKPLTGSRPPANTCLVVAGSKIVPLGAV